MSELSGSIYQHLLQPLPEPPTVQEAMQQGQRSAFGQLALQEARRQRQAADAVRAQLQQRYRAMGTAPAPGMGAPGAPEGAVQETVRTPYSSDLQAMLSQYAQEGADVTPTPGARVFPGGGMPPGGAPAPAQPPMARQSQDVLTPEVIRQVGMIDPAMAGKLEQESFTRQGDQLKMLGEQNAMVAQVARGILLNDTQDGYVRGVEHLRRSGIPVDHLPARYDRRLVEQYEAMTTDAATRLQEAQAQHQRAQAELVPQKLALDVRQQDRLERQYELDVQKYGLQEADNRRKAREAQRKESQAPDYGYDHDLNAAIFALHGSEIPPGGTPTPTMVATARKAIQEGKVTVSAAQGAEQARIKRDQEPLDPTTAKAVSDLGVLQDMTDDVTDMFDPGYVGQFEGRWGAVKEWTGNAGQREVVFRRVVADMKDQLLRARSGAAITQQEYERLATMVPNITDNEETFKGKLLGFRRAMDQSKQRKLETATTGRGPLRTGQPGVTPLPGAGAARSPHAGKPIDQLTPAQKQEELDFLKANP